LLHDTPGTFVEDFDIIVNLSTLFGDHANCITENVTLRRIVASGKMLLSDRRKRQSEEQHDEPKKQARIGRSSATTLLASQESGKAKDFG